MISSSGTVLGKQDPEHVAGVRSCGGRCLWRRGGAVRRRHGRLRRSSEAASAKLVRHEQPGQQHRDQQPRDDHREPDQQHPPTRSPLAACRACRRASAVVGSHRAWIPQPRDDRDRHQRERRHSGPRPRTSAPPDCRPTPRAAHGRCAGRYPRRAAATAISSTISATTRPVGLSIPGICTPACRRCGIGLSHTCTSGPRHLSAGENGPEAAVEHLVVTDRAPGDRTWIHQTPTSLPPRRIRPPTRCHRTRWRSTTGPGVMIGFDGDSAFTAMLWSARSNAAHWVRCSSAALDPP